ncbi:F-box/LRR-repeat protein 3 [Sesamum angolense]|uniref:F-box/LRR-repeat protein 3 n=1 Tax=Sesamum angolense TaxID=2727404 RepID=A0AAE1WYQ7_9LAMI|nr:F-box/LRR-repeat protein 3 [Sesamum angolense]
MSQRQMLSATAKLRESKTSNISFSIFPPGPYDLQIATNSSSAVSHVLHLPHFTPPLPPPPLPLPLRSHLNYFLGQDMDMDSTATPTSSILTLLTDDLLLKILSLLPHESDRKSFRSTCKTFYRLDSLYRTHIRVLRPEFLPSLLSKLPHIASLDLSVCPSIDDAAVPLLLSSSSAPIWARRIKRLKLSRCPGLRFQGLETLVRYCVNLESVDVSYSSGFGDLEAAALSASAGLREVCLDKCLNIGDVGLAKIAVGCPKLERLSLKWCFEITDIGVELLSKKCDQLKHLDISYLKVTSESLRWIGRMERLEILQMVGCGLVDGMGLQYIGKGCPSLQVLDVSRCDKLTPSALSSVIKGHNSLLQLHASYCFSGLPITFVDQFKGLKKLKVLRIDGARVSDATLKIISENCKFLTEIWLGKCQGVTDAGIMQLVSGCGNLKVINLTCCGDLSDSAILAISDSCRDLLCLKLECCNLLSEWSLDYIGSRCFLLEEVDLTDCPGINDIGLNYLSKCLGLVSLKLGLCTNVSDKGLSYIALNCRKIRELDLYRCTEIGDDGLAALSCGCKKLQKLILSYCDKVTDRGMECLSSLEELSDLELRGLPNITGTGLRKLAAGCRRLAELDLKSCENIDDSGFWALAYYSRNLRQVNFSGCAVSDVGLCMVMGNLTRLQDAKLVNLMNVSTSGFELALRACCARLKKVKLLASFRRLLSPEVIETLEAKGCRIRWD